MDGPPPTDPSIFDRDGQQQAEIPAPVSTAASSSATSRHGHASVGSTSSIRSPVNTQPQRHQLLSTTMAGRTLAAPTPPAQQIQQTASVPATASAPAPSAANDLFSLDFHNPTPAAANASAPAPKKDMKQDILSLYSTPSAPPAQPMFGGQFGAPVQAQAQNAWGQYAAAATTQPTSVQTTSMMGTTGWGASAGWNGQPAVPAQPSIWGAASPAAQQPQVVQQSFFDTNDIWASSSNQSNGAPATRGNLFGASSLPAKKDDVFGDIWGGFK